MFFAHFSSYNDGWTLPFHSLAPFGLEDRRLRMHFLAHRTIGRAFGTLCHLSLSVVSLAVCLSVTFCIVVKRYVELKTV